jgi:PAS domain S-box-containing protein
MLIIFIPSYIILFQGIKTFEKSEVIQNVERVQNVLSFEAANLGDLALDYAQWDDTCDFVVNRNPAYIESNYVDATFSTHNINVLMIQNLKGEILYSKGFDCQTQSAMPVSETIFKAIGNDDWPLNYMELEGLYSGMLLVEGKPLVIFAHPITQSDGQGDAFGTMILGRYLETDEIMNLGEAVKFKVTLTALDQEYLPPLYEGVSKGELGEGTIRVEAINGDSISGYVVIKDIFNQPAFLLEVNQPRDNYNQGLSVMMYYNISVIGLMVVFLLVLFVILKKNVLSPLTELSTSVNEISARGIISDRLPISKNDEIAQVARAMNKMLRSIGHYQRKLEEQEAHLRRITDSMLDVIYEVDKEGMIRYVSSSSHGITGYQPEELVGTYTMDQVHPDDVEQVKSNREKIRSYNSSVMEIRAKHKEGHYVWVEVVGNALYDDNGEYGIIFSTRDITARKQIEQEIKKAYDELEVRVEERTSNLSEANLELCSEINERKRVEEALQYQVEFEKLLAQISTRFIKLDIGRIDDTINQAMKEVGEFVDADRCYIFLFDHETGTMDNTHEWCNAGIEPHIDNLKGIPYEITPWWMAQLRDFKDICISRVSEMPPEAAVEQDILLEQAIQSLVVVPIAYRNALIGYLGFDWVRHEKHLFDEGVAMLSIVSEILTNAFQHKWSEEALAKQRAHLSATLTSISDGVISIARDGNILMINNAARDIVGWSREEDAGSHINDILNEIDKETNAFLHDEIQKMLVCKENYLFSENIILNKNDTKKVLFCSSTPMLGEDDHIKGYVLVLRDITEKKKIEDRLALSQKMESVGVLAAGIAHEINTPMQFIGDNTTFLKDAMADITDTFHKIFHCIENSTEDERKLRESADEVRGLIEDNDLDYLLEEIPMAIDQTIEGIDRVSKLVLTLKNFSHPGTKEKMLANINRSIVETITISRNEYKYILDVETDLPEDIPLVYCHIDEIHQVLLNLIINASHAIKEAVEKKLYTRGKIQIATMCDGDYVKITIRDNGVGIPEEYMNRIYDPFFTTKDVGKGTGQGLSLSHDIIVNKHRGSIEVESEIGKGTLFTIALPLIHLETFDMQNAQVEV